MQAAVIGALDVPSAAWTRWEIVIHDFEHAWRQGQRPPLTTWLPPQGGLRQAVLTELALTELELRLKNGEQARVEDYLAGYPELASCDAVVLELVIAERQLRGRWESGLGLEEYYERFPHLSDLLPTRLGESTHATGTPARGRSEAAALGPPVIPDYHIGRELGRGGMGVVYKARHKASGQIVALKTIAPSMENCADVRERFALEASLVDRLHHPNFARLLQAKIDDPCPFLEFEYIAGGSLRSQLARNRIPIHQAAWVTATLARALHSVHSRGIIHCDLKPANIFAACSGLPVRCF
jgi:hypothetical protein